MAQSILWTFSDPRSCGNREVEVNTSDCISPWIDFGPPDIHITDRYVWTRSNPPFRGIVVYTDGSKMYCETDAEYYVPEQQECKSFHYYNRFFLYGIEKIAKLVYPFSFWNRAGVFCDALSIRESYKLRNNCSLFQTENFAVRNNEISGPVNIYVDSQAILKALNSLFIKSMAVLECGKALENTGSLGFQFITIFQERSLQMNWLGWVRINSYWS